MDKLITNSESGGIPKPETRPSLAKKFLGLLWITFSGGALIGATLGCLYWAQQMPKYKATAQVQFVTPPKEMPISTFGSRMDNRSREDELVVVRSSAVLRRALERGNLTSNRQLVAKTADEIVQMLQDVSSKMLEVKLGSNDPNSDIIDISVTTDDPNLSAEIVQAIVSGYEDHINQQVNSYSRDAINALSKFSDIYEKRRSEAKRELDKIQRNPSLIWIDGKPRSPASDKIVKCLESVSEIDAKMKNIDAVVQQIDIGREAGRPLEELLRMASSSASKVRATSRKAGVKDDESVSVESRLKVLYGTLKETLQKLSRESDQFKTEAEALRGKAVEDLDAIRNHASYLEDLEAIKEVANEIGDSLRKLSLGSEFGVSSIMRLEIPTAGKFEGPYLSRFAGLGALIGACAFSIIAFIRMLANESSNRT